MNVKQLADQMIDAVREFVARALEPLEMRLRTLEERPAPKDGQDGKSVTLEDVRQAWRDLYVGDVAEWKKQAAAELLESAREQIAAMPRPKDGTSVTLDDVRPMVEEYLRGLPAPKDGQDGKSVTIEEVRPILDAYLRTIPAPKDGQDGKSVTLEDVQPMVEEYLRSIPKPRDGQDGKSVTLEEVRGYLDTEIATWALAFERRANDVMLRFIESMPRPKDGRDGLAVEDFDARIEGRTITLSVKRGDFVRERQLRIPAVLDAGVFREGTEYEHGDGVTFGGSFWIAQKDRPVGKPGTSPDWRLAVKAGRDANR